MFRNSFLFITFWLALVLFSSGVALSTTVSPEKSNAELSRTAQVNGTALHYLSAGSGPITVVLVHGWPQSSYEWRKIMPQLAKTYRVIAVDLRGVGGSRPTSAGYDKANMARDVHGLVRSLGLHNVYVFGHDIGGMVSYAYLITRLPQPFSGRYNDCVDWI